MHELLYLNKNIVSHIQPTTELIEQTHYCMTYKSFGLFPMLIIVMLKVVSIKMLETAVIKVVNLDSFSVRSRMSWQIS